MPASLRSRRVSRPLLVDPDDSLAFAEAISRMINDDSLRRSMIDKGLARVQEFPGKKPPTGY